VVDCFRQAGEVAFEGSQIGFGPFGVGLDDDVATAEQAKLAAERQMHVERQGTRAIGFRLIGRGQGPGPVVDRKAIGPLGGSRIAGVARSGHVITVQQILGQLD